MNDFWRIVLVYLLIVNLIGILVCKIDKEKAIHHQWRIKERTIFMIALLGGGLGVLIGMYSFRHKTQHMKFVLGIPAILLTEIIVVVLVILKIKA